MAKRKQWKPQQKSKIVLQALQGRAVADICVEYGITTSLFYKWKEQFLRNMHLAYEVSDNNRAQQKLKNDNNKLKNLVAELSLELKKSDW